jgi:hypothetical protein
VLLRCCGECDRTLILNDRARTTATARADACRRGSFRALCHGALLAAGLPTGFGASPAAAAMRCAWRAESPNLRAASAAVPWPAASHFAAFSAAADGRPAIRYALQSRRPATKPDERHRRARLG